MRLEIRQINDGRGPYRWFPVIRTPSGLARGGIHDQAHDLEPDEIETAKSVCPPEFELREVPA